VFQLDKLSTAQFLGGAVTAALGFLAAYVLARLQRLWDAKDAATAARASLIQQVRVPLEIIREEIRTVRGFYYTRADEEGITRALREAIYGLRDETLIREFETGLLPLRSFALGTERKLSGERCKDQVDAMLKRLAELETKPRT